MRKFLILSMATTLCVVIAGWSIPAAAKPKSTSSDGKGGGVVTGGWDLKQNKKTGRTTGGKSQYMTIKMNDATVSSAQKSSSSGGIKGSASPQTGKRR